MALDLPLRRGSQIRHPWTRLCRSRVTWFKKGPWDALPAAMSSWAWVGGRPGLRVRVLGKDVHSPCFVVCMFGLACAQTLRIWSSLRAGKPPRAVSPHRDRRPASCRVLAKNGVSAQSRRLMCDCILRKVVVQAVRQF